MPIGFGGLQTQPTHIFSNQLFGLKKIITLVKYTNKVPCVCPKFLNFLILATSPYEQASFGLSIL